MSINTQNDRQTARPALYAAIVLGLVIVAGIAAWSINAGGLPGTKNSPSAVVNGETMTGKTAN